MLRSRTRLLVCHISNVKQVASSSSSTIRAAFSSIAASSRSSRSNLASSSSSFSPSNRLHPFQSKMPPRVQAAPTPLIPVALDMKPIPMPLARRWLELPSSVSASTPAASAHPFTIVSFNMLAQSLVRRELYPYCSATALKGGLRRENLLKELLNLRADILCLQEVDRDTYETFWIKKLSALGYKSVWGARNKNLGPHGCVIFYLTSRFESFAEEVIQFEDIAEEYREKEDNKHENPELRRASVFEEMNRANVALVVGLRVKAGETSSSSSSSSSSTVATPLGLVVSTTHLFWDPRYRFVRLKQCQVLLDTISSLQKRHNTTYPTIQTGDWNATPCNIIYRYLTRRNELKEEEWNLFLTPAEHGIPRGETAPAPVPPVEVPPAELNANSGVSNDVLAKLQNAVKLAGEPTASASAASSSASASSSSAASSGPSSSPTPLSPSPPIPFSAEDTWKPASSMPIHQIRSHLVTQADGSLKLNLLERVRDATSVAGKVRWEEVRQLMQHSRQLPLLQSVYSVYDQVVPEDAKESLHKSYEGPDCKWRGEPAFTNYTGFKGTLDYIFVPMKNTTMENESEWNQLLSNQSCSLQATHILEVPRESELNQFGGLPNDTLASDHISIAARFVFGTNDSSKTMAGSSSSSSVESTTTSATPELPPFNPSQFKSQLKTKTFGQQFHYLPVTDSTMTLCKDALFGSNASVVAPATGTVWLADEQTAGRGRIEGRKWQSARHANVTFTTLIQLMNVDYSKLPIELTRCNQSVCLAVAVAIEQTIASVLGCEVNALPAQLQPRIKWPNDVWINNNRKCSGMLIDTEICGSTVSIVAGIGINVNEKFDAGENEALRISATSIQQAIDDWRSTTTATASSSSSSSSSAVAAPSSTLISRESVLARFLFAFESFLNESPESVLAHYRRYDLLSGREVTVMPKKVEDATSYYQAKAIGYTAEGYLIVEDVKTGQRIELVAEEVTIRPVES